jgi:uncharacterized protein
MKCPVCPTTELRMTDRQGVEIDYCPQCRGVWLDRGELDKIVERSAAIESRGDDSNERRNPYPPQGYPQQGYPQQGYPQQGYPQQGYGEYKSEHKYDPRYKKKKGFLGDLFDFD